MVNTDQFHLPANFFKALHTMMTIIKFGVPQRQLGGPQRQLRGPQRAQESLLQGLRGSLEGLRGS